MADAEVIILPVVRVECSFGADDVSVAGNPADVTDIKEYRRRRERLAAERRAMTSLLPEGEAK